MKICTALLVAVAVALANGLVCLAESPVLKKSDSVQLRLKGSTAHEFAVKTGFIPKHNSEVGTLSLVAHVDKVTDGNYSLLATVPHQSEQDRMVSIHVEVDAARVEERFRPKDFTKDRIERRFNVVELTDADANRIQVRTWVEEKSSTE